MFTDFFNKLSGLVQRVENLEKLIEAQTGQTIPELLAEAAQEATNGWPPAPAMVEQAPAPKVLPGALPAKPAPAPAAPTAPATHAEMLARMDKPK